MFKSKSFYILLKRNQVEIIDLDSGTQSSAVAESEFSTPRIVLQKLQAAIDTVQACFKQIDSNYRFSILLKKTNILIQQMEGDEGGLSQVEIRALLDLAEQVGGKNVVAREGKVLLSNAEALQLLADNRQNH